MPSHPDRVRRSYHEIKLHAADDEPNNCKVIRIRISKQQIASDMSRDEVLHNINRLIKNGIIEYYVGLHR